ncbi:MAG: arginine deiminase-related protein [Flavobacteriales bacterium]
MSQVTDTVLMIEPVHFHYNAQTAANNFYQKESRGLDPEDQQIQALAAFQDLVELLQRTGVRPFVVRDTKFPETPDSIFPNNWVSFHEDGRVVFYPMFAPNRRLERRRDILGLLEADGFEITELIDYSEREEMGCFLEGTGSMVLDRSNRIAYGLCSARTDKNLFEAFCADFNYRPIAFHAVHRFNGKPKEIYHTNVMMTVADSYAIVALDAVVDKGERQEVTQALQYSGKEIIAITSGQVAAFAGNALQLKNSAGHPFLLMSTQAYQSLKPVQIKNIARFNPIRHTDISIIEQNGGGGVRCMMAEVFLPRV